MGHAVEIAGRSEERFDRPIRAELDGGADGVLVAVRTRDAADIRFVLEAAAQT